MGLWILWCVAGLVLLVVEMFTPVLFCLNLSLACFVAAFIAIYDGTPLKQVLSFVLCAVLFVMALRPIMLRNRRSKDGSELTDKYVGQIAEVVEPVTKTGGRIAIYDETWKAMSATDDVFESGQKVRIIENVSIVMLVGKV